MTAHRGGAGSVPVGFLTANRQLPLGFTEDMILKAPSPDVMNKLARNMFSRCTRLTTMPTTYPLKMFCGSASN